MGRAPCCEKVGIKRGPWSPDEDQILITYIKLHGHENWRALPKKAGLLRCGKSCRLRWINYLRPDIKRGNFTGDEEDTIVNLHQILGSKWSAIAARLPGRTDNEIKNVWHTHLKKRLSKKQEENFKETSSPIINKSQPVTTNSSTTSRGHHVPCSTSIAEVMSTGSTTSSSSLWRNELLDIVEPFWLSEEARPLSGVTGEGAAPFQLSPLSGFGIGSKAGYETEFWYKGFDYSDDFFAPNML